MIANRIVSFRSCRRYVTRRRSSAWRLTLLQSRSCKTRSGSRCLSYGNCLQKTVLQQDQSHLKYLDGNSNISISAHANQISKRALVDKPNSAVPQNASLHKFLRRPGFVMKPDNGLTVGGFDDDEDLEGCGAYHEGGTLPVHIGDLLLNYKVIHKVTVSDGVPVWLCRDLEAPEPKYYAIKVLPADKPSHSPELWMGDHLENVHRTKHDIHLLLPLKRMTVQGPCKTHEMLVYPVFGPQISELWQLRTHEAGEKLLRTMSRQIVQTVSDLHSANFCHGDVTISNVFVGIKGLDGRSEEDIINEIGLPERERISRKWGGESHTEKWAPQYLVRNLVWSDMESDLIHTTDHAYLFNFHHGFLMSDPPDYLNILVDCPAPELLIEHKLGFPSDIWGLGCALFEIRTGRRLFYGTTDSAMEYTCLVLGKMPEPWWSETWKRRRSAFADDVDEKGHVVRIPNPYWRGPRSIRDALESHIPQARDDYPGDELPRPLDPAELDLLCDLLEKIFRWKPSERITAQEVLEHPYFTWEPKHDEGLK